MLTAATYIPAAIAETAGCFSFWTWLLLGKSAVWLVPGCLSLALFGWLLTLSPADSAGRSHAAHGGGYIISSLLWIWIMEGVRPDRRDILGASVAIVGAVTILLGPRGSHAWNSRRTLCPAAVR